MEKDEGDATMEELDATKNLNLVDVNEPVQSDVVESEQEEVTNENGPSSSTTDNGLNRIEEKVIQETLTDGAGIFLHILPVPYLLGVVIICVMSVILLKCSVQKIQVNVYFSLYCLSFF